MGIFGAISGVSSRAYCARGISGWTTCSQGPITTPPDPTWPPSRAPEFT
jgi:hypothetical protein